MKAQLTENIENTQYNYATISGQQILEISGVINLRAVIVNRGTSGEFYTIYDSAISGRFLSAGVSIVGIGYCGSEIDNPREIKYDVGLKSGLVIVASGASWLLTTTYK